MLKLTKARQEAVAVTCLFIGLVLVLSLISYSLPLLGHQPALQQPIQNWCGHFGYYTARYLLSFLGVLPFFLSLLFFYLAAAAIASRSILERLPFLAAGLTGILIAAAGLLAGTDRFLFPPEFIRPGGFLGHLLRRLLTGVLGSAGSSLLLLLLLIFSMMAAARFSPVGTAIWLQRQGPAFFAALSALLRERLSVWQEAREQRRILHPAPVEKVPVSKPLPVLNSAIAQKLPFLCESAAILQKLTRQPVRIQEFRLPPFSLLDEGSPEEFETDRQHFTEISETLTAKLLDFAVKGAVVGVSSGPVVTTYEFAPAAGIKINKIMGLADDLAMALKVEQVRVAGSVPGKAAVGIEVPNTRRKSVLFRGILTGSAYQEAASCLTLALGADTVGQPVLADLARMPHLLIAGATGAGKSVAVNAFICSILCKAPPDQVQFLLIDPKRIELSLYEGIPHLLHPVVTEPKMASQTLLWATEEMERRYQLLEAAKVRSIAAYNETTEDTLPYVVIVVDELADLMMAAAKDVETSLIRLAQMARAAGMHIILATQRPSAEVLTGLIKANFPTRIAFKVASRVDSRTILDSSGAEHLLGLGDMLFLPPGAARLQRIHGAFISEAETRRIVRFLKEQGGTDCDENLV